MEHLVTDMVQNDPTKRPTMDEVVTRFSEIRGKLNTWKLRSGITRKYGQSLPGSQLVTGILRWLHRWLQGSHSRTQMNSSTTFSCRLLRLFLLMSP